MTTPGATPTGPDDHQHATRSLLLASAAVAATVALWLMLAATTGLIFHFLPGATFLAATYVFRLLEGGRRVALPEQAALVAVGAFGTAIGLMGVTSSGHELDGPLLTSLVVISGAALATIWSRRASVPGSSMKPGERGRG